MKRYEHERKVNRMYSFSIVICILTLQCFGLCLTEDINSKQTQSAVLDIYEPFNPNYDDSLAPKTSQQMGQSEMFEIGSFEDSDEDDDQQHIINTSGDINNHQSMSRRKRQHSPYNFGLGKRFQDDQLSYPNFEYANNLEKKETSPFTFGIGKRDPMPFNFGVGKRESHPFTFGVGKRDPLPFSFGMGKRESHPFTFGVGKRNPMPFNFGVGKREPHPFTFGVGKRSQHPFTFGVGKREPLPFTFGVGKKIASPFSFGVGKREPLPFTFGVGKRNLRFLPKIYKKWLYPSKNVEDLGDDVEAYGKRLYSFGIGKRSAGGLKSLSESARSSEEFEKI